MAVSIVVGSTIIVLALLIEGIRAWIDSNRAWDIEVRRPPRGQDDPEATRAGGAGLTGSDERDSVDRADPCVLLPFPDRRTSARS